jgi:hypothetical protein
MNDMVRVLALLPAWPYSSGWGYFPSGGALLLLLIILVVLFFAGKRP